MPYTIRLKHSAERDLEALPRDAQGRVARVIDALAQNPFPHGCKKLAAEENLYRVRAGAYRIIYQVQQKALIVLVIRIKHRRDVYRR